MTSRRPRSLKSRALQLLAQREQSRAELRRKLMVCATAEEAAARLDAAANANEATVAEALPGGPADAAAVRVDAVLTWLEANRFVSDERFAESRAHARESRYGTLRIRLELKQHGVALPDATALRLQDTEESRALAVWQRRFGHAPNGAAESAKQARFLTSRGFTAETVRRVLRARSPGPGPGPGPGPAAGPGALDGSTFED